MPGFEPKHHTFQCQPGAQGEAFLASVLECTPLLATGWWDRQEPSPGPGLSGGQQLSHHQGFVKACGMLTSCQLTFRKLSQKHYSHQCKHGVCHMSAGFSPLH